ncbi:Cerevisin [Arthrobotrys entomopaga]|nr:Cerevisin [Arthrobotrys entomopaga]
MYFLHSTLPLLLILASSSSTTTSATPLPHNGENHDTTASQTSTSIPSPHPTAYSHYIFHFPTPSNGTKVDTSKILASLAPHGFNMSHLHHTYSELLNGFAAHMSDHCVSILQNMNLPGGVVIEPVVTYTPSTPKPNFIIPHSIHLPTKTTASPTVSQTPPPPPTDEFTPLGKLGHAFSQNSTWGLKRICQRRSVELKDGQLDTDTDFLYVFDQSDGFAVDVYVLDMGVNTAHVDFIAQTRDGGMRSRANATWTAPNLLNNPDEGSEDRGGHGTHCAGTIGSRNLGVTKETLIHSIKVLRHQNGGLSSDIIAGLEFITKRHKSRLPTSSFKGSVASMSFGIDIPTNQLSNTSFTTTSPALESAIISANLAGIHTIIAAGNQNIDACRTSPGFLADVVYPSLNYSGSVITVGASDIHDNRAPFSNYGRCITTYAPGVDVLSTYIGPSGDNNNNNNNNNETRVMSGTSMAAPHVAGLVAYLLNIRPDLRDDPRGMKSLVMDLATRGRLGEVPDGTGDSKIIAYNGGMRYGDGVSDVDPPV